MPEMPYTGHHHGKPQPVGGGRNFLVSHRAAGLHYGRYAGFGGLLNLVHGSAGAAYGDVPVYCVIKEYGVLRDQAHMRAQVLVGRGRDAREDAAAEVEGNAIRLLVLQGRQQTFTRGHANLPSTELRISD